MVSPEGRTHLCSASLRICSAPGSGELPKDSIGIDVAVAVAVFVICFFCGAEYISGIVVPVAVEDSVV